EGWKGSGRLGGQVEQEGARHTEILTEADDLAFVVDPESEFHVPLGERRQQRVQVGHHPALPQKRMPHVERLVAKADHLAEVVDVLGAALGVTGQGAQVGHHPVLPQHTIFIPPRARYSYAPAPTPLSHPPTAPTATSSSPPHAAPPPKALPRAPSPRRPVADAPPPVIVSPPPPAPPKKGSQAGHPPLLPQEGM